MIGFTSSQRYYLSRQAADMRKSYDGLGGVVRQGLGRDPLSGEVFIFLNRRRTMVKLLVWDRSGFVIWGKRLERGTFELPRCSEAWCFDRAELGGTGADPRGCIARERPAPEALFAPTSSGVNKGEVFHRFAGVVHRRLAALEKLQKGASLSTCFGALRW